MTWVTKFTLIFCTDQASHHGQFTLDLKRRLRLNGSQTTILFRIEENEQWKRLFLIKPTQCITQTQTIMKLTILWIFPDACEYSHKIWTLEDSLLQFLRKLLIKRQIEYLRKTILPFPQGRRLLMILNFLQSLYLEKKVKKILNSYRKFCQKLILRIESWIIRLRLINRFNRKILKNFLIIRLRKRNFFKFRTFMDLMEKWRIFIFINASNHRDDLFFSWQKNYKSFVNLGWGQT